VIEIGEIEAHFALSGRGDLDQPTAEGEAFEGAPEHDAADQIQHDIGALAASRRANLARQVLRAGDQLLRNGVNRRVRVRRAPVGADNAGADASSDLGGGAADAASGADQKHGLAGLQGRRVDAAPRGEVIDADRRRLIEAEGFGLSA
jgi:hypothetical protein